MTKWEYLTLYQSWYQHIGLMSSQQYWFWSDIESTEEKDQPSVEQRLAECGRMGCELVAVTPESCSYGMAVAGFTNYRIYYFKREIV